MKHFWEKYNGVSLILRIVIGLAIGAVLGVLLPASVTGADGCNTFLVGFTQFIILLGTLFTSALKGLAPVLVFFIVISALANAKGAGTMKTIIILYLVSTFIAALVAVVASFIFPIDMVFADPPEEDVTAPSGIAEVLTTLVLNAVANPVDALVNANYIGILCWAVVLGIALRAAKDHTKEVFENVANAVAKIVEWVISFAPFGIMGLIYKSVSSSGIEIFTTYGLLILLLVGCMLVIAFGANPLIAWICIRENPYPLDLRCLKDSGLMAFFTRSSAANIPVNMRLCRALGLDEDNYSVSIPLGATINMAGASVTISVMTMATCHALGVSVDIPTAVILSVLSAISACGASGVAGGSLLLIPLACSLFGISNDVAMQVVGVGFVIGVIQDSCETAINSSSDALFTAVAEYRERRRAGIPFHAGKDDEPVRLPQKDGERADAAEMSGTEGAAGTDAEAAGAGAGASVKADADAAGAGAADADVPGSKA